MAATKKGVKKKAESAASPTTASARKSAPKTATKAATKTATPAATKTATKAAAKPKAAANGKPAAKKAAPIKLTDKQRDILGKIHAAGESGYEVEQKADQRVVDALLEKRVVKKGAKDKATGKVKYMTTKAGQKALTPTA